VTRERKPAANRREQIVRATIRSLARDGGAGLSTHKVAREIGVRQGLIHHYFKSKHALLLAALEATIADVNRRLADAEGQGGDARGQLRTLISALVGLDQEVRLILLRFSSSSRVDRDLRRIVAAFYHDLRNAFVKVLQRGQQRHIFRLAKPEDAADAARVIVAVVEGMALQSIVDPGAISQEDVTRLGIEAVTAWLEKPLRRRGR